MQSCGDMWSLLKQNQEMDWSSRFMSPRFSSWHTPITRTWWKHVPDDLYSGTWIHPYRMAKILELEKPCFFFGCVWCDRTQEVQLTSSRDMWHATTRCLKSWTLGELSLQGPCNLTSQTWRHLQYPQKAVQSTQQKQERFLVFELRIFFVDVTRFTSSYQLWSGIYTVPKLMDLHIVCCRDPSSTTSCLKPRNCS